MAVMSSQDSIGTVLKCMQKGAVDFLVKPVRKNELRNLWQHVWRRHAVSSFSVNLQEHASFGHAYWWMLQNVALSNALFDVICKHIWI
jgi:FixJ family two-component response regulator